MVDSVSLQRPPTNSRFARKSLMRLGLALVTAATLAGCASARNRTEGPTLPIDLEIHNNLPLPTDLTIYAVSSAGIRSLLGSVPPATTRTLRFKPVSFSERDRLLATRAGERDVVSEPFSVGSDMTGAIVWTLVPNIVGFEEVESDTSSNMR
jgi:hypothetical protein